MRPVARALFAILIAAGAAAAACAGTVEDGGGSAAGAAAGGGGPSGARAGASTGGAGAGGAVAPGGGAASPGGAPATPGAGGAAPAGAGACVPGGTRAPARRLTRREYDNTVRDLLGDTTRPASAFAADGALGPFDNNAGSPVTVLLATDYQTAAERLARAAVVQLATLVPCRAQDAACAGDFVTRFGRRAFRRPLEPAEVTRYTALYNKTRAAGGTFADGIRVVITAFLQSPFFLNHIERGGAPAAGGLAPLTPHELAARLSYFLWGTMPDDPLAAAADAGKLPAPAELEAHAQRLLMDPRARASLRAFFSQWLDLAELDRLEKSKTMFPRYTDALPRAMRAETEAFVDHVMGPGDGRVATLLSGSFSFLNQALAGVYGVSAVTGTTLRRVDLDPRQRAGLLTQPAFLAMHATATETAPVRRGKFVRERILCHHMPSPPADVNVSPPPPDPELTTRQRYEQAQGDPFCGACHRLLNPIGLSLEMYDALGQYRDRENGLPIDASGDVLDSDVAGKYDGAIELARRLAGSAQVRSCFSEQWLAYAVGREAAPGDRCWLDGLARGLEASGGDLRRLALDIVKSEAFRTRGAIATEVCR